MHLNDQVAALIDRFPGPTNHSIENEAARETVGKLLDELLAGGAPLVAGLIDLLAEPGQSNPADAKARFLLHAAVVRAGAADRQQQRQTLAAALAAALATPRPAEITACLVRELQWIADAEQAPALGPLLADEALCDETARALVKIGGEAAAAQFRAALEGSTGVVRLTIVQNLGVLRDARSAPALLAAAGDADEQVRIAAVWALANVGEPRAVDVALKAAAAAPPGNERHRHTDSCLLLGERLASAGRRDEARQLYRQLQANRPDPRDAYVREAAGRALAALEG